MYFQVPGRVQKSLSQSEVWKAMRCSRASFSCRIRIFSQIKKTILNNKNLYVTMQKQGIAIIKVILHAFTVEILGSFSKPLRSYGKLFPLFCVSPKTMGCHVMIPLRETDQSQLRFHRGQTCVGEAPRNFNFLQFYSGDRFFNVCPKTLCIS